MLIWYEKPAFKDSGWVLTSTSLWDTMVPEEKGFLDA